MSQFVKERVSPHLNTMHSYMWDGCHKIYINFDEASTADGARYDYEPTVVTDENRGEVIPTINRWWEESCWLKFIQGIKENPDEVGKAYFDIIGQGENDPEDITLEIDGEDWEDE